MKPSRQPGTRQTRGILSYRREEEKICLTCQLSDCKGTRNKKCPVYIYRKGKGLSDEK